MRYKSLQLVKLLSTYSVFGATHGAALLSFNTDIVHPGLVYMFGASKGPGGGDWIGPIIGSNGGNVYSSSEVMGEKAMSGSSMGLEVLCGNCFSEGVAAS